MTPPVKLQRAAPARRKPESLRTTSRRAGRRRWLPRRWGSFPAVWWRPRLPFPEGRSSGWSWETTDSSSRRPAAPSVAYEADGERTRWGLPGAGAVFVAEDSRTVVLLGDNGDVVLRQRADGVRMGGFSTGFAPDQGILAGSVRRPAPAALAAGVLYWVSSGTLRGYGIPAGTLVSETTLPEGEATSVVVVPAPVDSAGGRPAAPAGFAW